MGIIDTFSDRNERDAADELDQGYKKGYRGAKKDLGKGFRGLKKDYAAALNKINAGEDRAAGYLTEGRDQGNAALIAGRDAGLAEYEPYATAGAAGSAMYTDAIGLGGEGGNARAVDAFRAGPGYDFRISQGMEVLQRLNASKGRLDSGNTMIDAMRFAGGEADQEYGTWLDRLMGQQEMGVNVAGAKAGLYAGTGGAISGNYMGTGGALGGNAMDAATKGAAIKTGLGDVKMGYGEKLADLGYATRLGRAGVEAGYLAGKDQSGANAIGAITGGASLGAKLLGAG
jgi:hypothetical protein